MWSKCTANIPEYFYNFCIQILIIEKKRDVCNLQKPRKLETSIFCASAKQSLQQIHKNAQFIVDSMFTTKTYIVCNHSFLKNQSNVKVRNSRLFILAPLIGACPENI